MKERIKTLNTELEKLVSDSKTLYGDMEAKSEKGTKSYDGQSSDAERLRKMADRGREIREELKTLTALTEADEHVSTPASGQKANLHAGVQVQSKTLGQQVIEADEFKSAAAEGRFKVELKGLNEGTNTAGGYLVQPDRRSGLRAAPERPITLLDVLPVIPTNSNLVEYITQGAFTNNADFVAEGALKPESDLAFGQQSAKILVIAHWIEITRQMLEDAPRIRAYVDGRLLIGLRRRLEEKVVSSSNSDFLGLLNRSGVLTRVHGTASGGLGASGDSKLDTIRFAMADLAVKFYQPDTLIINAIKAAELETLKDSTGQYLDRYDPVSQRVWRLRVVEVPLMPNTTALVLDSDFSAEIYDRGVLAVRTGEPGDFFLRNKFAILAEGRYGMGLPFPEGVNKVTGL